MPFKTCHPLDEYFLLLAIYYCLKPFLPTWQMFQAGRSSGTSPTRAEKGQDSSIGTSLNSMVNPDAKYPFNYLPWPCFLWNLLLHICQLLSIQTPSDSHSCYIWKRVYYLFLCLTDFFPLRIYFALLYCIFTYGFQSFFFSVFHFTVIYAFWKVSFTS